MSFKDIFKKSAPPGPEVIEIKKEKKPLPEKPSEIIDFSFNEYRFGHREDTGTYFKIYPVPASLYGFFKFVTEDISHEEYLLWEDSLKNPSLYVVTAKPLGRGYKYYSIQKK